MSVFIELAFTFWPLFLGVGLVICLVIKAIHNEFEYRKWAKEQE